MMQNFFLAKSSFSRYILYCLMQRENHLYDDNANNMRKSEFQIQQLFVEIKAAGSIK